METLASASFARAFTVTVIGTVFSSFAIERTAGRVTYATIIAGLCAIAAGMLIARRDEIALVRLVPWSLLAFLAWALVSALWSTDRGASWWSWVSTAAIAFLAVTIGQVRDTLQTARAVGDVLRVLLGISLGVEVLSGALLDVPFAFLGVRGNLAEFGPLQGIFGTRNMLGFLAVIALVTFMTEYWTQSVRTGVTVFSVSLAGVLAMLSTSPTVFVLAVAVATATAALALVRRVRPERRTAAQWVLAGVVGVGVAVGVLARHPIIAMLNAGTDISMRVDLWNLAVDYVRFRPIRGWGWFGPWAEDFPFTAVNLQLDTAHATALSAYVDVVLQLGWVGLALFVLLGGAALVRSWLDAAEKRSITYAWTPLIMVTLAVDSVVESFTLAGPGWLLLVICAVRAGQSRSWRERVWGRAPDSGGADLPQGSNG